MNGLCNNNNDDDETHMHAINGSSLMSEVDKEQFFEAVGAKAMRD